MFQTKITWFGGQQIMLKLIIKKIFQDYIKTIAIFQMELYDNR